MLDMHIQCTYSYMWSDDPQCQLKPQICHVYSTRTDELEVELSFRLVRHE
jgi:hypothetical protein